MLSLVIMALAAAGLIAATVTLALRAAHPRPDGLAAPLAMPAPAVAAGLPRGYLPIRNAQVQAAIADFRRRFAGSLMPGSPTRYPAGLYREPGTPDLVTGSPGWLMYLGYNSPTPLGSPATTSRRLIHALARSSGQPWRVAAGQAGGAAWCVVTVVARTPMSVCTWATGQTAGAVMSPTRDTTADELAALLPQLRTDWQPT
ncbi:MAG: hypothetical protein ACYCO9_19465 [Streptosporangiaceae bacterium]